MRADTKAHGRRGGAESGFSLIELLVAMAVMMIIAGAACNLLLGSLRVRARESQRSEALADAQRALYSMSREIAQSGFGLSSNGLVAADSGQSSIRVRANLNAFDGQTTSNLVSDSDEDVKYLLYTSAGESYVVRLDVNTGARTTVLANRVDSMVIRYYDDRVSYTAANCDITTAAGVTESTKSAARFVVVSVCVQLPAVGAQNSTGYQPASSIQLTSGVSLRNADLTSY